MTTNGAKVQSSLSGKPPVGPGTQVLLKTGLTMWRGVLDEEKLSDLRPWSRAFAVFTEMSDDGVIGAMLESIKTPLLSAEFEVFPASNSPVDQKAADFLRNDLFSGMTGLSWREHVEEMLEFLIYGWSIAEKVYEKGPDGFIHLKALLPIGQETLSRWGEVDTLGRVTGFIQQDPMTGGLNTAPIEKLLHFTFRTRKRNPMGHSLLRSLYRPWYFKKNLEVLEAIGVERDIGNAPVLTLGEGYYSAEDMTSIQAALEGLRVDETLYIVLPNGSTMSAFGGGNKVYNVREIIRDWQHIIRQRFFADFLSLGSEQVGTQALAREMTTFFSTALGSIQQSMVDVWTSQLVKSLFFWNTGSFEGLSSLPKLTWTHPGKFGIQTLAQSFSTLVGSNLLTMDVGIENRLRTALDLPPISEEEYNSAREATALAMATSTGGGPTSGKVDNKNHEPGRPKGS